MSGAWFRGSASEEVRIPGTKAKRDKKRARAGSAGEGQAPRRATRSRGPGADTARLSVSSDGAAAKIEHDLRERVKELQCLYGIAQVVERCSDSLDRILQGIADLIPPSWQHPEAVCARISLDGRQYETDGFRATRWRQTADVMVAGEKAGRVEVCYLRKMPASDEGPFQKEERALIDAVAERTGRIVERIRAAEEVRRAHRELQVERRVLQEANVGLRTALAGMEDEKKGIKATVLANVDRILMPILHALETEVPPAQKAYVELLKHNLEDIVSPFVGELSRAYLSLTPVEIQICSMIRSGMATKKIARTRRVSSSTVCRHREHIRRKLGLTNRDVNLVTYLQTFGPGPGPGHVRP